MSTINIAAGVYPLEKFFLPALGEVATWKKYRDFLLAYWVTKASPLNFELFEEKGVLYIKLINAITSYTKMADPLTAVTKEETEVWIEGDSKEHITGNKLSDLTTALEDKGVTDENVANSFYAGSFESISKKLEEAKKVYYGKYGEYPVRAKKITYTKNT